MDSGSNVTNTGGSEKGDNVPSTSNVEVSVEMIDASESQEDSDVYPSQAHLNTDKSGNTGSKATTELRHQVGDGVGSGKAYGRLLGPSSGSAQMVARSLAYSKTSHGEGKSSDDTNVSEDDSPIHPLFQISEKGYVFPSSFVEQGGLHKSISVKICDKCGAPVPPKTQITRRGLGDPSFSRERMSSYNNSRGSAIHDESSRRKFLETMFGSPVHPPKQISMHYIRKKLLDINLAHSSPKKLKSSHEIRHYSPIHPQVHISARYSGKPSSSREGKSPHESSINPPIHPQDQISKGGKSQQESSDLEGRIHGGMNFSRQEKSSHIHPQTQIPGRGIEVPSSSRQGNSSSEIRREQPIHPQMHISGRGSDVPSSSRQGNSSCEIRHDQPIHPQTHISGRDSDVPSSRVGKSSHDVTQDSSIHPQTHISERGIEVPSSKEGKSSHEITEDSPIHSKAWTYGRDYASPFSSRKRKSSRENSPGDGEFPSSFRTVAHKSAPTSPIRPQTQISRRDKGKSPVRRDRGKSPLPPLPLGKDKGKSPLQPGSSHSLTIYPPKQVFPKTSGGPSLSKEGKRKNTQAYTSTYAAPPFGGYLSERYSGSSEAMSESTRTGKPSSWALTVRPEPPKKWFKFRNFSWPKKKDH